MHEHVFLLGNEFFPDGAFGVGDLQAYLALGFLAEGDGAGHFGQHALVFGAAGLKQLGHAGQTAGDVAGFLAFHGHAGKHFAGADFLAVAHLHERADLKADGHGVVGAGNLDFLAFGVEQFDQGAHDFGGAGAFGVDDGEGGQAGDVVGRAGHGDAFFHVLELHRAGVFGDDGARERIPVGEDGAGLDGLVGLDGEGGAIGHLVALALAAEFIDDDDFAGAGDDDQLALGVGDVAHGGVEADDAAGVRFDAGGHGRTRGRAADVEGAHGQLRARLADGLRGDDADGFAHVHKAAAAQIAPVALGAHAEAGGAGQGGAHAHFVDAGGFEVVNGVFVEHLPGLDDDFTRFRIDEVFGGGAAQDALAQRFDDFTAFDDGAHDGAVSRAAVFFGDHKVLRHIHQAAREVAGVGGFQRRVGQALARAVRGDEVLQHVQPLAEVGGDGRFDDGAVRLGHEAAHAGQLADLGGGAARAGVGHHVDGIEGLLIDFLAVAVLHFLLGQLAHHDLGDFVARLAPDVHHFVVALACGDKAGVELLGDFFHLGLGAGNDFGLLRGHEHVFNGNGDARARGQPEAVLQELVGHDDGVLEAAFAEGGVDQARDFLFLQRLVQQGEGQALGQDFRQQGAAHGGVHQAGGGGEVARGLVLGPFGQAHGDFGSQLHFARVQRALHFTYIGEHQAFALAVDFFARGGVQAQHHVL